VTGATYQWVGPNGYFSTQQNPTISAVSPQAAGIYTVYLTLGSCQATASTTVTVNNPAPPTIRPPGPVALFPGQSVTLTASPGVSWVWSPTGATTQSITVNTAGTYSVTVTDGNGCDATSTGVIVGIGSVVTEFPGTSPTSGPVQPIVGPDGNIWFTDQGAESIGTISASGVTEFPTGRSVGHGNPNGIAALPGGNLWFTEFVSSEIGQITTAGQFLPFVSVPGSPEGITVGQDGNLWFCEFFGNKIGKMSPSGTLLAEYPATGSTGSEPNFIVADSAGNLWFTEYGASQIGRLTLAGVLTHRVPSDARESAWGHHGRA